MSIQNRYQNARPLRTLFSLYGEDKGLVFLSLVLCVIKHTPLLMMPVITGNVVTIITDQKNHSLNEIWINAAIIAVLLLQNIPVHTLYIRYLSVAIRRVEARLRNALIRRLQELSISFHDNFESGRLQAKVLRDVEAVEMLSRQLINVIFMSLINLIFVFVVTVRRDAVVTLFFVLTIPLSVGLVSLFRKRIRIRNREFRSEIEQMSARVSEMVDMIPITRAHGVEEFEIHRVNSQVEKVKHKGIRLDTINAFFSSSAWVIFQAFQFLCLMFTGFLAFKERIAVGDVVMYQGFFNMLVHSVSMVLNVYPQIARGFESIHSIGEVLECPDIEHNMGKKDVGSVSGKFSFIDVNYSYDDETDAVIKDFSLDVEPGETIAVVGESGAGKSTLMSLIIGYRRPSSGKILLDGVDMEQLDLRTYRRFLAIVPQNTILYSGTVRENIIYGMDGISEEKLIEVVQSANIEEFVTKLPQGLNTPIGEHGIKMSGGQRQRISIARALIRDPQVIIFDEATSSLDVASEKLVQDAIDRLVKDRTTFIVAHRLSTIRRADRIVVLKDGRCVEMGTHDQLMAAQGEFYQLKSLQF
jgi:ATP-binding cassette subfamily B protein